MEEKLKLTTSEYVALSDSDKKLYDFAMGHIDDEWACGPYGGWSRALDALKELGYIEHQRQEEHRIFTSLEKPTS